jgi:hypothetical protein
MSAGKKSISEELQVFLKKLKQLETKSLARQLTRLYGWTAKQALAAILRYLMFLCLTHLYPHHLLVPTPEVDAVWHCHILQTRKYREDCQFLFGCYLDHEPEDELEEISPQPHSDLDTAFTQTQVLFEQHFGIGLFEDTLLNSVDGVELNPEQQNAFKRRYYAACGRPACGKPACGRPVGG